MPPAPASYACVITERHGPVEFRYLESCRTAPVSGGARQGGDKNETAEACSSPGFLQKDEHGGPGARAIHCSAKRSGWDRSRYALARARAAPPDERTALKELVAQAAAGDKAVSADVVRAKTGQLINLILSLARWSRANELRLDRASFGAVALQEEEDRRR